MSAYDDQFMSASEQLQAELSDVVCYTPVGGQPLDLPLIVGPERLEETMEIDGVKRRHIRECSIPRTRHAAGGGYHVYDVAIHDVFEFRGESYMVHKILARTSSITRVEAIRLAVHEETRQGLRRRN